MLISGLRIYTNYKTKKTILKLTQYILKLIMFILIRRIRTIFMLVLVYNLVPESSFSYDGMKLIPESEFQMGKSKSSRENGPEHSIYLNSFYIDIYEVIQKDFSSVMGENPSKFIGEFLPVESVTWQEAKDYCEKLGKRLPTEAEWEKAAKANTSTNLPWGDLIEDDYLWYSKNSSEKTHIVGTKKPNPFGLYDMLGNVYEWVYDWFNYDYYSVSPFKNPTGPLKGSAKVLRGGSWFYDPLGTYPIIRGRAQPDTRDPRFGFRCATNAL